MNLSQSEWTEKSANKDFVILDVRTPEEFIEGHIPNSQLLDIRNPQDFMEGVNALDSSKTYLVYCRSGARSAQACQVFKLNGFDSCYNLLGGILEWQGEINS